MIYEPTSDHEEIRRWAKLHSAHPAERLPSRVDGEEPVLALIFHRGSSIPDNVIPITWEEFFERFDRLGLSFLGTDDMDQVSREYRFLYDPAEGKSFRTVS
ncbi:hypothetical protein [Terriglobus sp.]|uniref:hypothetical protein n=1 Tax=Terriglobus sp. TaxID=1889013 RepID=UPI003AFFAE6B